MAFAERSHSKTHEFKTEGFVGRLGEISQMVRESWAHYRIYRQTLAELSALSERELADLGLSRAEIKSTAMHAADDSVRGVKPH